VNSAHQWKDRVLVGVKPGIEHDSAWASKNDLADPSRLDSVAEFEGLLRAHDRAVRCVAYRLVGDDVDDVLQVAYLKAFEQRASFRGDSSTLTWLHTIVYRTALDHLRSRRRREDAHHRAATVTTIADGIDAATDRMAVEEALAGLPIEQRVVLLLVDGQDMSYDNAAQVLGVANGTIASRIHRARTAMRTALDREDDQ
jgi:RNA polymerase sigma-70 factor (ECF subfamily)